MSTQINPLTDLITAAETLLRTNPAFRLRPIGAPGSAARQAQDDAIAAEDQLRAAITKAQEQT
jgi:hypothetical protein